MVDNEIVLTVSISRTFYFLLAELVAQVTTLSNINMGCLVFEHMMNA